MQEAMDPEGVLDYKLDFVRPGANPATSEITALLQTRVFSNKNFYIICFKNALCYVLCCKILQGRICNSRSFVGLANVRRKHMSCLWRKILPKSPKIVIIM
jgi:hypothetical protein